MSYLCRICVAAIMALVIPEAFGQTLSLGAVAGSSLTSDYGGTGTYIFTHPGSATKWMCWSGLCFSGRRNQRPVAFALPGFFFLHSV